MVPATLTTPAVEKWRPIEGYEGLYEVSNLGRVRSLYACWRKNGVYLTQTLTPEGYYKVGLYKDGVEKWFQVHRILAGAFIPNPDNLPCVNHKDEIKTNNSLDNLEWCTKEYNNFYGSREGICKEIEQLTLDGQHVAYYKSIGIVCREFAYVRRSIQRVLKNQEGRLSAYGYRWRYVNNPGNEDTTHT